MTTAVEMMTNDIYDTVYFAVIDAESSANNTEFSAIIMMMTVFHKLPSAIHDATVYLAAIDAESSADNAISSAIIMMTTAFHELPSAIHSTAVSIVSPSLAIDSESSIVIDT